MTNDTQDKINLAVERARAEFERCLDKSTGETRELILKLHAAHVSAMGAMAATMRSETDAIRKKVAFE